VARIERIGGQVDSIGRFLTTGNDCADGLALLANLHRGINNLMAEVSENHIRQHVIGQERHDVLLRRFGGRSDWLWYART
jgi:DNA-binding FrmR family transcriptional regulator